MSMEYLEQYFRYCALQKNLDPKTLKAYRIDLEQLADHLRAGGLEPTRAALEEYVEQLSTRCKPATVKRKYAAIRAYFRYLYTRNCWAAARWKRCACSFARRSCCPA